jgi:PGF-pre-PGF domain-containing protein
MDNARFLGILFFFLFSVLLVCAYPAMSAIIPGEGPYFSPENSSMKIAAFVNLSKGDMFFTDSNALFIVGNFSCTDLSVCNSSTIATANFSQVGGSGIIGGIYKTNSSDASWALFEFNSTVNFSAMGSAINNIQPLNVTLNATCGNGTTLSSLVDAPVLLVNMSVPPGCPPSGTQLPPQVPLTNGSMVNISGCQQCGLGTYENAVHNGSHWLICGPTFGGSTTNFTQVADLWNFSNFDLVLDVPGRGKIDYSQNVSFDNQQRFQAIMEFAVQAIMSGGRIGMNETEWNGSLISKPNLNISAELTIYNASAGLGISGRPQIYRYQHNAVSGSSCGLTYCAGFSWDGDNVTFTVNSWSDYGLSDAINVTLNSPANGGYAGGTEANFTYTPDWDTSGTNMVNCSLYGNFTGTWGPNTTNQSVLANDTVNWINQTVVSDVVYLWNVYCYDSTGQYDFDASNRTIIGGTSTTTTTPVTTTVTSAGGGHSSTDFTIEKTEQTFIFSKLSAGAATVMKVTDNKIGFKQIQISLKNQTRDVTITVQKLEDKPATVTHYVSGTVYKYVGVTTVNIDDDNIQDAEIEFEVNKTWFIENNLNPLTVLLNRYGPSGWEKLDTNRTGEDDDFYHYKALTPGFSTFAITAGDSSGTTTIPEVTTTTPEAETTTVVKEFLIDEDNEKILWVIVIAVFVATVLILQKIKWI